MFTLGMHSNYVCSENALRKCSQLVSICNTQSRKRTPVDEVGLQILLIEAVQIFVNEGGQLHRVPAKMHISDSCIGNCCTGRHLQAQA